MTLASKFRSLRAVAFICVFYSRAFFASQTFAASNIETINQASILSSSIFSHSTYQHDVPQGKHALITVKQPKGNLVWIIAGNQSQQSKSDKEKMKPQLKTWDECDVVQVRNLFLCR